MDEIKETIRERHHRAMALVDDADRAKRLGDMEYAIILYGRAYEVEIVAAGMAVTEPSRSVLYRSAATLAYRAGRYAEALQAIEAGLVNAPCSIAIKLNELLAQIPQ